MHLGIPLPDFPGLTADGYSRVCGARAGRGLFAHPVPSVSRPTPQDPAGDEHIVTLLWLPPGVSLEADFRTARVRGLVWMVVEYGGRAARPVSAEDRQVLAEDDRTLLTWPDGRRLGVQWMDPADTRLAWPAETADHRFWVSLRYPGSPVAAVDLLRGGVDLPW